MAVFTQRMPDDLHEAMRAWLRQRPWLSMNDLVNAAIAREIGHPDPARRLDLAPPTLEQYAAVGAMRPEDGDMLRDAVSAGRRIAISGPPASGKTSLLRALLSEYQSVKGSPRRAMLVSPIKGEIVGVSPLLSIVAEERWRGLPTLPPDVIEAYFVDELWPEAIPGLVEAWGRGAGGAAVVADATPTDLEPLIDVRVTMREGAVTLL